MVTNRQPADGPQNDRRPETCDGYEWRDGVPWKCKLPPGHKTSDGTFLGRSCWGDSEYRVLDGRDRVVLDQLLSESDALKVRDTHEAFEHTRPPAIATSSEGAK